MAIWVGICLGLAAMAAGCVQQPAQPAPVVPKCPPCPTEEADRLTEENQTLQRDLAASHARIDVLERAVADLEIQMLQNEAHIIEWQRRALARQKQLDGAITEVVRTKSKLRSIESKAEAASTIAEAEIAVRSMKSRIDAGDQKKSEALQKAEQLLHQSTVEFEAANFGGALYLAVQSKNQIGAMNQALQVRDPGSRMAGETTFDLPLSLKLHKNTNLRSGPGLTHRVHSTLQRGRLVVGYAYKEDWIRIGTDDGQSGWVHQSLVTAR